MILYPWFGLKNMYWSWFFSNKTMPWGFYYFFFIPLQFANLTIFIEPRMTHKNVFLISLYLHLSLWTVCRTGSSYCLYHCVTAATNSFISFLKIIIRITDIPECSLSGRLSRGGKLTGCANTRGYFYFSIQKTLP